MTIVSEKGTDRPSTPPTSTVHDVQLFAVLCPGVCILTEDVINNASFMSCVKSAQTPILYFDHLRKQYTMYKQRERQNALKRELEEIIDAAISAAVNEIKKAADVKLSPSLGLATLAKSCTYKQQLLTNIPQSLLALKSKISSTTLLNNLRRRLKQQKATTSGDYNVDCFRTSDFTWEEAYRILDMAENTGVNTFPLDYDALRLVYTHILYMYYDLNCLHNTTSLPL